MYDGVNTSEMFKKERNARKAERTVKSMKPYQKKSFGRFGARSYSRRR